MSNIEADIFLTKDAQKILKNKYIILIGDSVIRSIYKDLIKLLQTNSHLTDNQLKTKGEYTFENDQLLEGGLKHKMSNDVTYTEVREYKTEFHLIRFYFITRCYSDYLMSICDDIKMDSEKPDVVIMNSGCWDLTRYGSNSIYEYKKNLPMGIFSLIRVLPSYTLFLWTTTLPLSRDVKGGFMIPEVECRKSKLREDVLEANRYAHLVMNEFKLDLLDLHYHFLNHIQRRAKDGIHWDATAHRRITNLILNHICDCWDLDTPGRILVKKDPSILEPSYTDEFYENYFNSDEPVSYDDNSNNGSNYLPTELTNRINEIKNQYLGTSNFNQNVDLNNNNYNSNNNNNICNKNNDFSNNCENPSKRLKTNNLQPNSLMNINLNYQKYPQQPNNLNVNSYFINQQQLPQLQFQNQFQHQLTQILTPLIHQQLQRPQFTFVQNSNIINSNDASNKNYNNHGQKRKYPG